MTRAALLLLVLAATSPAQAQQNWSAKNQPHHAASVHVVSEYLGTDGKPAKYGLGSGTYVGYGEMRGVLTAAHVVSCDGNSCPARVYVAFSDGTAMMGNYTADRDKHDIAWIYVKHASITPAIIAASPLQTGQVAEMCSHGGPWGKLRHLRVKVHSVSEQTLIVDEMIVERDSGGGVFFEGPTGDRLAGVIRNGERLLSDQTTQNQPWKLYRGGGCVPLQPIHAFVRRVHQRGEWRQKLGESVPVPEVINEDRNGVQYCQPWDSRCQPCYPNCQPQRNWNIGPQFNFQQAPPQPQYQQPQLPPFDPSILYPPAITDPEPGVPVQPTEPAPQPTQPTPEVRPEPVDLSPLLARLDAMEARLKAVEAKPDPIIPADNTLALQGEIAKLRADLNVIADRGITVSLYDAEGNLIPATEKNPNPKTYPPGQPIKLQGIYKSVTP